MPILAEIATSPARLPTVIGSEGAAGLRPENTLAAVEAAVKSGVDGVELDFHVTADGQLIAHHNFMLNPDMVRNPDGSWIEYASTPIKSLTVAELKSYDVGRNRPGSRTAEVYPEQQAVDGERMPTLDEIIALLDRLDDGSTEIWIEIKSNPSGRPDVVSSPDSFIDALAPHLDQPAIARRACILAFDWRVLQKVAERWPHIRTSYLTINPDWISDYPESMTGTPDEVIVNGGRDISVLRAGFTDDLYGSPVAAVAAAGGTYWSPFLGDITPELISEARALGLKVSTWAADGDAQMAHALALGLDSITNSRPDLLKAKRDQNA